MKKSQSLTNYNKVLAKRQSSPVQLKQSKNILERSNIINPKLSNTRNTSYSTFQSNEKIISESKELNKILSNPCNTSYSASQPIDKKLNQSVESNKRASNNHNTSYSTSQANDKKLSQLVELNKKPSVTRNTSYSAFHSNDKKLNQSVEIDKKAPISNSHILSNPKYSSNPENASRPNSSISRTPQSSSTKAKSFSFEDSPAKPNISESKPSVFKAQSNLILNSINPSVKAEEKKQKNPYQFSQAYKKCVICYNELISRSYFTPKCKKHTFCLTCIKGSSIAYKKTSCNECENFFDALNKKGDEKSLTCLLCKKFPEHKIIDCKVHEYCKECFNFLINNEFDYIEKVYSCANCKKSIGKIVYARKQRENLDKEIFTPRTLRSIGQATRRDEVVIPFSEPKAEPDCYNPYSSRDNQKKKLILGLESANLISKKPDKKNDEEKKIDMAYAVKKTKKKCVEESQSDMKSYRLIESCIKCILCGFNKDIKAFSCNHNLCMYCLVGSCCKSIMEFYIQYQVNNEIIKEVFCYKCPYPKCETKIGVPTMLVIKSLIRFLDDNESAKCFESFVFLKQIEVVRPWIPYFDGFTYWTSF